MRKRVSGAPAVLVGICTIAPVAAYDRSTNEHGPTTEPGAVAWRLTSTRRAYDIIREIRPLSDLSVSQRALLDDILEDHSDLGGQTLVVYSLTGEGPRDVVAPQSPEIQVGMQVDLEGWVETRHTMTLTGESFDAELGAVQRLVPARH